MRKGDNGGKGGKDGKASYEIGYKKPPKDNQFQPGQSGCPSGGKKRAPKTIGELSVKTGNESQRLLKDGKIIRLPKRQISAKQLYLKALNGDTGAFVEIYKREAAAMEVPSKPKRGAPGPTPGPFNVTLLKMGRPLATHCDECGEPACAEIRRAMREYEEQGYVMPPLRHNGPPDDRIAQLEIEMEKRRAIADAKLAAPTDIEPRKKLRRKKNRTLGEWLLAEGSTRIKVNGVWKLKRKHILDVQYAKANQGDRKAIAAIARLEDEEAKRQARAVEMAEPLAVASHIINVTLAFDDEVLLFACDACDRILQEEIAQARGHAGCRDAA